MSFCLVFKFQVQDPQTPAAAVEAVMETSPVARMLQVESKPDETNAQVKRHVDTIITTNLWWLV